MMILIIALVIVSIGIVIYLYNDLVNTEVVEYKYDDFSKIMTVKSKSKTGRLFTDKYAGGGAVWYHLPDYKRCNIYEEIVLSKFYRRLKHIDNTKY